MFLGGVGVCGCYVGVVVVCGVNCVLCGVVNGLLYSLLWWLCKMMICMCVVCEYVVIVVFDGD